MTSSATAVASPFGELVRVATRRPQTDRVRQFTVVVERQYRPQGKTAQLIDLVAMLGPVSSGELARRIGVRTSAVASLLEIPERYGIVRKAMVQRRYEWEMA